MSEVKSWDDVQREHRADLAEKARQAGRDVDAEIRAFEEAYAKRAGVTVEQLHEWGRRGALCDCGHSTCEGFQMLHRDD